MEETGNETNLQKKEERINFILSLIFVSLLGILILVVFLIPERGRVPSSKITEEAVKSVITIDPFRSIEISAQAVYVFDAQTGEVFYAHNEEAQLPLASITKLMTVIVASEEIPLQSVVTITLKDLSAEGDSGLLEGERWRLEDILGFTLMVSSNDGARALATASLAMRGTTGHTSKSQFALLMNKKAEEMNLPQTYFLNPTGLDTSDKVSGGYGSARDVAYMLRYALLSAPSALGATRSPFRNYQSLDALIHPAKNTNQVIHNIPGLIASKTGYTDLAGGNLVVAFDAGINRPIIIALLGSSLEGRFNDIEILVQATLSAVSLKK